MTHPILPLAVCTVVVTSGFAWRTARRQGRMPRRDIALLLLAGLPLSALVNELVKGPAADAAAGRAGLSMDLSPQTPWWFLLFALMLAPVTEEVVKLLPLGVCRHRLRRRDPLDALWTGAVAGLGFGIGEVVFLAWRIVDRGQFTEMPWYSFTGFMVERFLAVPIHGLLTALVVHLWLTRGWPLVAALGPSIAAHAVTNLFALLALAKVVTGTTAMLAASLVPVGVLLVLIGLFERLRGRQEARVQGERLWTRPPAASG